ncbi:hypothetical protein [Shouchella clausii]|uniref:Uncharacterized protein n=1 Tax=Shouchella clausii TaxID=79880 RepID=A0A268P5E7_SHOCL|nr:hypothetical protein [Shouchella clausii]PAE90901.1 hypothetical protein CHH72_00330 [Shouchella clausii]
MELPETSKRVLQIVERQLRAQNEKGIAEYGQTIDDAQGYDWTLEALSECVDAMQYMARRMLELEGENERIRTENERIKEGTREALKIITDNMLSLEKENKKLKEAQASQTN